MFEPSCNKRLVTCYVIRAVMAKSAVYEGELYYVLYDIIEFFRYLNISMQVYEMQK